MLAIGRLAPDIDGLPEKDAAERQRRDQVDRAQQQQQAGAMLMSSSSTLKMTIWRWVSTDPGHDGQHGHIGGRSIPFAA